MVLVLLFLALSFYAAIRRETYRNWWWPSAKCFSAAAATTTKATSQPMVGSVSRRVCGRHDTSIVHGETDEKAAGGPSIKKDGSMRQLD
jgi:hypothetical protein